MYQARLVNYPLHDYRVIKARSPFHVMASPELLVQLDLCAQYSLQILQVIVLEGLHVGARQIGAVLDGKVRRLPGANTFLMSIPRIEISVHCNVI